MNCHGFRIEIRLASRLYAIPKLPSAIQAKLKL